jgi:type II secretory pathway predicted ATPase ExeA
MYESFFGLSQRPFSKTPDPAFLYEGRGHAEALARLLTAAEDKDIGVLTGEIGAGKTTLSRAVIDRLDERFRPVLVINPRISAIQLLGLIARRLGVDPVPRGKMRLIESLLDRLYAYYEEGAIPLVIIDEAQMITSKSVFDELRLLTNMQLDDAGLVGLLLLGQPELKARLEKKTYRSFAQRIGMAFHLGPLSMKETGAYVNHRLRVAGRDEGLFAEEALERVHAGSGGIPRRINTICQGALLSAFGQGMATIEAGVVADVVADLQTHLGAVYGEANGYS